MTTMSQRLFWSLPRSFTLPKFSFKLSLSKFLQMKLNSLLFRFLPFSWSRFYIFALGRLYYFFNRKEKTLIQKTIRHIYQRRMDEAALRKTIRLTFQGIFDHYHEKLFVGYSHFPRLVKFLKARVKFTGKDKLQEALQEGKGVILVTGHFGAVEFLPGSLALNGLPASMICRFQTNRLRISLSQRAELVGLDLIDADEGNIVLSAMKALKQGRILITECDEFDEWRPDSQRHSYFLGQRLSSDRTLELLRKRSGATIFTALVRREGKKRYTCDLVPVGEEPAPVNISSSEQCLQVLESGVDAQPQQWYQWKKLGKMIASNFEVENDYPESGFLAPEIAVSYPD